MSIVSAILFVPMTLIAGAAIDLVGRERIRVALQDALDRGVLAAASLTQDEEPRPVVLSYLKKVPQAQGMTLDVSEERRTNYRRVTATAMVPYPTSFLRLAKVNAMDVQATAAAEESRRNVEISMVLDISGSMLDNKGIFQLKPAAKEFLDIVLKPDLQPVTSVSIVPFAGGVNLGKPVFDNLVGTAYVMNTVGPLRRRHNLSSCFRLADGDFNAGVPTWPLRWHMQHYSIYNIGQSGKKAWWCPQDEAGITYLTNDLTFLKNRIDALEPYDGTGTAYGVKWGELLLNPAMQPKVKEIGDKGLAPVPAAFRSRPAKFDDTSTVKFIVLMTDGQIGTQPRPKDEFDTYTSKNVANADKAPEDYTQAAIKNQYYRVCAVAKSNNITVFTIAFKVDATIAAEIAKCASNASYAYNVDTLDMGSAFRSIASTIQQIRLVR